ncbi:uncharacterized protein LOC111384553 [Olea europaea var. sylvestris]|uniref:uncharacterized protein LOC111384553 n=1 Tax=Olea europaea var. sylvestris TaxID=158386 RepID=UPI000C1D4437|nr:uncharacterized protein LOC111384553 [Olea europaea var. sylvestris]
MALTSRAPCNLPSNTKINPKEQAKAITTRSGVQLPEIHVKRPSVKGETSLPTEEETMEQDEQPKESTPKGSSDNSRDKATAIVNPHEPPTPFPQRLRKHKMEQQYKKFLEVFKKLHINILLADALTRMPSYAKFFKDILSNKRKLEDHEIVMLTKECSARIQKKLPSKLKDLGSFIVPYTIGEKHDLEDAKATTVTLQLVDRSLTYPRGIIEDVLIMVEKFIFLADFLILDMEENNDILLILGKPFLATERALIDVQRGQLILRLEEEHISFNVFKDMKLPSESDSCFQVNVIDKPKLHQINQINNSDKLATRVVEFSNDWSIRPVVMYQCIAKVMMTCRELEFEDLELAIPGGDDITCGECL